MTNINLIIGKIRENVARLRSILEEKNWIVFVFFLLMTGAVFIHPIWHGSCIYACGDYENHIRFIRSAYHSLFIEHTFPPCYANDMGMMLQPIFKYYSVTLYTVSAFFMLFKFNGYQSLLLGSMLFYASGAFGVYLLGRCLQCKKVDSILGGLTYLFSPYMFVTFYARGAFAEMSALGVIPWVFYGIAKLNIDHGSWDGLKVSLITGLLIITHKIFFAWTIVLSVSFVLFFIQDQTPSNLLKKHLIPTVFWIGFGMLLAANYWLSTYYDIKNVCISSAFPWTVTYLSHWKLLLSPVFAVSPQSSLPNLATQYGLVFLFGHILLACSNYPMKFKLAIFALSFYLFLAQTNLFRTLEFLPTPFSFIQFPYRLLIFSAIAGSLAVGVGLSGFRLLRYKKILQIGIIILLVWTIKTYRNLPPFFGRYSQEIEQTKVTIKDYQDKIAASWSAPPKRHSGIYECQARSYIEQGTTWSIRRRPFDHAILDFNANIPNSIEKQDIHLEFFIDDSLWHQNNFTTRNIRVHEKLPDVSSPKYQKLKIISSRYYIPAQIENNSNDTRQCIFHDCTLKILNRFAIEPDRIHVAGNTAQWTLEMIPNEEYYAPILYSKNLVANDPNISIAPYREGISFKSQKGGSINITISRKDFVWAQRASWFGFICLLLIVFFKHRKASIKELA